MCFSPEDYSVQDLEEMIERIKTQLDSGRRLSKSQRQILEGRLEYLEQELKDLANAGEYIDQVLTQAYVSWCPPLDNGFHHYHDLRNPNDSGKVRRQLY